MDKKGKVQDNSLIQTFINKQFTQNEIYIAHH